MMRIGLAVLSMALACGNSNPDPVGAGPGSDGGPAPDAGPADLGAHCGLEFTWIEPSTMGKVIATDDSIDPLSSLEATALGLYLNANGLPLSRVSEYDTQVHTMRYQTQDRGKATEATGYVIVPHSDEPQEFPVLLVLHGTSGLNDQCAPSRNLDDDESANYQVAALLSIVSSYGYIVVAPDYIGMKATGSASRELHPYLIGEPTAIAAWDSVRAAKKLIDGLDSTEATPGKIAVWGASQGGHAAAYTIRYAPRYAPEMDVAAAVYVVPPLDLAAHWQQGLFSLYSATGNIVLAFASMADWYDVDGGLTGILQAPYDKSVPEALMQECRPDLLDDIVDTRDLFTSDILTDNLDYALAGNELWNCIVEENTFTTTSIPRENDVPGLVILGENDTLVETVTERAAFAEMCAQGENWAYLECEEAEHSETFLFTIDNTLDFIDARLAGEPMPDGACAIAPPQRCSNQP